MSRKILAFLIAAAAVLVACGKEQEPEDTNLALKPDATQLPSGAGSIFVAVTATYSWTLSLEYELGGPIDWASVSPQSGSGSKGDVFFRFQENNGSMSRSVELVLTPAKGNPVRVTLTQLMEGEKPEWMGQYGYDTAPMDWLELPSTVKGDNKELLIHNMQGGKYVSKGTSGTRNWSCYWDLDRHLSNWVAYPLNNSLIGKGSRSDAWGFDPQLPSDKQPDIRYGSYGNGTSRGHQLPSADRYSPYSANVSTFYSTNLAPQYYDFNAGIWGSLEGKVRGYASRADTLYVVTGCLYDRTSPTTGSYTGFAVPIPSHYFKALLYRGSSTYATDGYMAAGFILPHDNSIADEECIDYICSIDELESRTGIDFFPNLINKIGQAKADKIEAAAPSGFWK